MTFLIEQLRIVDEHYEEFARNPLSHPKFLKKRAAFLFSSSNKLIFGDGINAEFANRWESYLRVLKEKRKNQLKLKSLMNLVSNQDDNNKMELESRSSSCSDLARYDTKVKEASSALKTKYLEFTNFPESHEDFAYFKERFRRNYKGLTHAAMDREWLHYWSDKMNQAYVNELDAVKRQIWKEESVLQPQKSPTKKPIPAVVVKKERRAEHEGIAGKIEQFWKEYDIRVREINASIRTTFVGYKNDLSTYPNILKEKEDYLNRVNSDDGAYTKEFVLNFNMKFQTYWNERVAVLLDETIEIAVKKARANLNELITDLTYIVLDDIDQAHGSSHQRSFKTEDEIPAKRVKSEVETRNKK